MTRSVLLVAALLGSSALAADTVTIKLGTLAPQGSTWHTLLKEMAEKFSDASGGQVKLKVYAGGTQGGEGDMVRKMGVGQLQAASITGVGMHDIAPEPIVFSAPGMVDEATFNAIFPKVQKQMEASLEAKGYVALHWAQVGEIFVYCDKPYPTPQAASDAKFFAWEGDPGSVKAFKLTGLRPVVLAASDIVPALQTGMITCITQAPAYMLTARLFERAKVMMDYPWSYLIGATVVRKDAWDRVPADVKPKLLAIARELGARIDADAKKLNDDAVKAMEKQGLKVVHVEPGPWAAAAEKSWPAVRGEVVPAPFFDEVVKLRNEHRTSVGKK